MEEAYMERRTQESSLFDASTRMQLAWPAWSSFDILVSPDQGGDLVERRMQHRKWKWIMHGSPKDHHLTSITSVPREESYLFFTTAAGYIFEYQSRKYSENIWLWHQHSTPMKGALENYNGSFFLVDTHGNLIIRERNNNELSWINCTAMRKGKHVNGGPPWDRVPDRDTNFREEDALFFVSRSGRLLQFTVAQRRKFKWKDCRHPPNVKVACIIDQEIFRENIVFVLGRNGRLYQYNKVSELWHEHYQSQHLELSRFPGTASRSSSIFLRGSLYMHSEEGRLIEYQWNANDGWNWVEHGKPCESVTLVGSPGPCFKGSQLFLIGSDGNVYLRYLDQNTWKWKCCGFPFMEKLTVERDIERGPKDGGEQTCCIDKDQSDLEKDENFSTINRDCNRKVATTRPIPFTEDSIIFELRDGRLAEMQHVEEAQWVWSRIIGTPTSLCMENYLTALAS